MSYFDELKAGTKTVVVKQLYRRDLSHHDTFRYLNDGAAPRFRAIVVKAKPGSECIIHSDWRAGEETYAAMDAPVYHVLRADRDRLAEGLLGTVAPTVTKGGEAVYNPPYNYKPRLQQMPQDTGWTTPPVEFSSFEPPPPVERWAHSMMLRAQLRINAIDRLFTGPMHQAWDPQNDDFAPDATEDEIRAAGAAAEVEAFDKLLKGG